LDESFGLANILSIIWMRALQTVSTSL